MNVWLSEEHTAGYAVHWRLRDIIHVEQTPYQELAIVDTHEWGRALILDSIVQTTEVDESIYHEMIAHVPMMVHPNPVKVLIIGGGDGGTLREVLKYDSVDRVDLVEIDKQVIEACRKYLPTISAGFSDDRANIIIQDGLKYVKEAECKYDVVIIDSSDPVGPAVELFSAEFYRDIYELLHEDGIMTVQAESPAFYGDVFARVYHNMNTIFPRAGVYLACVPSYVSGFWAFGIASKQYHPERAAAGRKPVTGLRYYTTDIHQAAFVLPPFVQKLLER